MTNGDSIITISKFIDDHVRFFFPEARKRLVQINRGIDTDYFNLKSVSLVRKENILKVYQFPKTPILCFFLQGLRRGKVIGGN